MKSCMLQLPGKEPVSYSFEDEETAVSLYKKAAHQAKYPIYGVRINGVDVPFHTALHQDDKVQLLDMRDASANMAYQTSLSLLYIYAVKKLYPDSKVSILNSLSKGVFTKISHLQISEKDVANIESQMRSLINENEPIYTRVIEGKEMLKLARKNKRLQQAQLFARCSLKKAYALKFKNMEEVFYYPGVVSSADLRLFSLRKYKSGIILRFPHPSSPNTVLPFAEQTLLYDAFSEAVSWNRIIGIHTLADLNKHTDSESFRDLVLLSEALHEKRIADIAQNIVNAQKRIILIAGPSSSGKTSFAKRLIIQLRVLGKKPLYLGTDDYFFDTDDTPLDEEGKPDFESLRAVDTHLFADNMNRLLTGEKVDIPTFDFLQHKKVFGLRPTKISTDQPIVIEGIHSLNPELTKDIPENQKYRIYISLLALTNQDEYNRIPTTDLRLLRRLVRDYRSRDHSPTDTLQGWASVRKGEEKYIFPYSGYADAFFNTSLAYEPLVLKKSAYRLLNEVERDSDVYAEAQRMIRLLQCFGDIEEEEEKFLPNNAILREFLGGSIFVK